MILTINGVEHDIQNEDSKLLLWVLRDELGLIGTKYGCGVGICGACTVHVDGKATRACVTPVVSVTGEVRTIEDLATEGEDGRHTLHPIQQAFLDHQVPQCSYCMSGQIMTAVSFLTENPIPTNDEIVEAMGQNYCRCGCYVRIKTAVADAATRMNEEAA